MTSELLARPSSLAAVVDTTGNFPVLRLYTNILSRLRNDERLLQIQGSSEHVAVEDVAAKALDRVKIMRVFDLVGIGEAVGEIRANLEGKTKNDEGRKEGVEQDVGQEEKSMERRAETKRTEIADSEDEDEDEMLLDAAESQTSAPPVHAPQQQIPVADIPEALDVGSAEHDEREGEQTKIRFILIDNLAHVVTPLLKKEYIRSNGPLSSFSMLGLTLSSKRPRIPTAPQPLPPHPQPRPPHSSPQPSHSAQTIYRHRPPAASAAPTSTTTSIDIRLQSGGPGVG